MPRLFHRAAVLSVAVLFLAGCATSNSLNNARHQFYAGEPEAALATLDKDSISKRNTLLAHLDTGLIAHTAGQYQKSIQALLAARELLEQLDFISVREQGASLITNEWATTYKGEYNEHLLIHTFQMMNFLLINDTESAAVEARQALKVLENHNSPLKHDWYSRALIAMSFEAAGKPDSAHIEYKKLIDDMGFDGGIATAALRNARLLGREDDARQFAELIAETDAELGIGDNTNAHLDSTDNPKANANSDVNFDVKNNGELVLFLQAGSIPLKRPGQLYVSTDIFAAFPTYPIIPRPHLNLSIDVGDVPIKHASVVKTQTVDVARAALGARGKQIAAKQLARIATKKNLAQTARRENEALGAILSVAFFALEQADTRSWETLPAHLNLVQIPLPAGTQQVSLLVRDGDRLYESTLENIEIKAGKRAFRALRLGPGAPRTKLN